MGQTAQKPFSQLLANWQKISTDQNTNNQYYKNTKTNQQIQIHKKKFSSDEQSYQKWKEQHLIRQQLKCPNIQKMIKNQTIIETLCSVNHQFYAIWEYHDNTLADQISRRLKNNKKFTQKEILSIAADSIQALEQMESKGIAHEKLSVLTIKLDQKGSIKICDPLSLNELNNYAIVLSNHNTDRIYLSPEQCAVLQTRKTLKSSSKNDIWTLGMILLQLGLLEDQNNCYYSEECRKLNYNKVTENLGRFSQIYSDSTKLLVESMLKFNKEERMGWCQLKSKFFAKNVYQSVVKVNALRPAKKQSPQVLQYYAEQEGYSFSKPSLPIPASLTLTQKLIHPHPQSQIQNKPQTQTQPNFILQPQCPNQPLAQIPPQPQYQLQKQNFNQSNVHFVYQMPLKQNKILINNVKPQYRQAPHPDYKFNAFPPTQPVNYLPSIVYEKPQQETPYFNKPIQSQLKKFRTLTSSKGYLFNNTNEQQKQTVEKKTDQYFTQIEKAIQNLQNKVSECGTNTNKFHIQNTQSITYEGQNNHVLNKKNNWNYDIEFPPKSPIIEKTTGDQRKQSQRDQSISPIQTMKKQFVQPTEKKQKIQYTIQKFSVGSRYEGYKLGNMRHGQGKFYYQDGGMYDGHWQFNRMQGKGLLYYQSGELAYEGFWKNDLFEGKGKLYNEQPEKLKQNFDYSNFNQIGQFWQYFDGYFMDDMKQGRGKLMLTNGEYFIGNFNQDIIQGKGKFFGKKGVIKGTWQNNHLINIQ